MKRLFILLLGFYIPHIGFTQLQIGLFGGIANYQGDLSARPYQAVKGVMGLMATYPLTGRINLRLGLSFAKVGGADSLNPAGDFKARNLSFQSPITELQIAGEYLTFDPERKSWSPYIFGGIALSRFNPFTMDQNGTKVYLQPLGTEGQGIPGYEEKDLYSRTQLAIPFGGGIRFNLTETMRLSVEIGLRKLFTDFLDDVSGNYADPTDLLAARGQRSVDLSYRGDERPGGDPAYPAKGAQRGSPKYKDYYYFSGVQFSMALPKGGGSGRHSPGSKRGYGCPVNF